MVPIGSFLRWLSSTAGYVPGNEAQLSSSDFAHHKRVLSRGCYPFLSGRSENLSVFLASLSASTKGVISNCKPLCLCSLPEPHDSVRRPFAGLKNRTAHRTDFQLRHVGASTDFYVRFTRAMVRSLVFGSTMQYLSRISQSLSLRLRSLKA
jgi:hypothetical protein